MRAKDAANNPDIPLKRPKNVSETSWDMAKAVYNAAVKAGDKFPELTVAQAALETGWFRHVPASYNFFGQKASKSEKGTVTKTKEAGKSGYYATSAKWKSYSSLDEALHDRVNKWGSKYSNASNLSEALYSIWQYDEKSGTGRGYATAPDYDRKVGSILSMMGSSMQVKPHEGGTSVSSGEEIEPIMSNHFEIYSGDFNPVYSQFTYDLEKEATKEEKEEDSEARQQIQQRIQEKQDFLKAFAEAQQSPEEQVNRSEQFDDSGLYDYQPVDVQTVNLDMFSTGQGLQGFQDGGTLYTLKGSDAVYRKTGDTWEVDWNRSGNFLPLSKGDVRERVANLNKNAQPLYDKDYTTMMGVKSEAPVPQNPFTTNFVNKFGITDQAIENASAVAPTVENAQKLERLTQQKAYEDSLRQIEAAARQKENELLEQSKFTNVPLSQVSDNTQMYTDDVERQAIAGAPAAREARKRQAEFERQQWEKYNKMSTFERVMDRTKGFMVDPLGMTSRALMGDQGYIPGMGEGLLNKDDPNYYKYLVAAGYTPGEFDMFDVQSMVNPMYWGASMGNNINKGNYLDAGIEALLTIAPMAPKGSIIEGAKMLGDDISRGTKYLTTTKKGVPTSTSSTTRLSPDEFVFSNDGVNYTAEQITKHDNTILDLRAERIAALQTPEGRLRLENYIKENPHLQGKTQGAVEIDPFIPTTEDALLGLVNMENVSKSVLENRSDLLTGIKLYQEGKITQEALESGIEQLKARSIDLSYNPRNAYLRSNFRDPRNVPSIMLGADLSNIDARLVGRHEIGHFFSSGYKSHLDDELSYISLNNQSQPMNVLSPNEESITINWRNNPNYMDNSRDYWLKGSEGSEKVPFMEEVRGMMLEDGTIQNIYDPITPDMLMEHYNKYMGGESPYGLRIYDIMENSPKNFNIMSSVMNKMPVAIPAALGLGWAMSGEEVGVPSQQQSFRYGGTNNYAPIHTFRGRHW